jgi:hypothetical protein
VRVVGTTGTLAGNVTYTDNLGSVTVGTTGLNITATGRARLTIPIDLISGDIVLNTNGITTAGTLSYDWSASVVPLFAY